MQPLLATRDCDVTGLYTDGIFRAAVQIDESKPSGRWLPDQVAASLQALPELRDHAVVRQLLVVLAWCV